MAGSRRPEPIDEAILGWNADGEPITEGDAVFKLLRDGDMVAFVAAADTMERDAFRGCLLGGAIGDALGAPVEFWSIDQIRSRAGPAGVTGYLEQPPGVTDDTQMTLFTAEGLAGCPPWSEPLDWEGLRSAVHRAYLRWLRTQQIGRAGDGAPDDGWLEREPLLQRRRAPGNACVSALASGRVGTVERPVNDSKGCGGVMRVAPAGLFVGDPEEAFRLGVEAAAITHGHPDGWLPAGVLAAIVSCALEEPDLHAAVATARRILLEWPHHELTLARLDEATALAERGLPTPEDLAELGGAWVGEEALAIAVACALAAPDFATGVLAAVNHSGDSDSTGSICGNLLGVACGESNLPEEWVHDLPEAEIVVLAADELWRARYGPR